jgi:hypothetical protein
MKTARRALSLALFLAAFAAAYQFVGGNADPVQVRLWRWSTPPAALWLVLVAAFAAGAAAALALVSLRLVRASLLARRYRKEVVSLESEVHQLRNAPLDEGRAG